MSARRRRLRGAWRPEAGALAAALPLAAVLWSARLPPSLGGLTPRAAGWRWAAAFTLFARSRAGRFGLPAAAYAGLLAAAAAVAWEAAARARDEGFGRRRAAARVARAAGAAACAAALFLLARGGWMAGLDLLENVAFPPESMSPAEPLATAALLASTCWLALRALSGVFAWTLGAGESSSRGARRAAAWTAGLAAVAVALQAVGAARYDAGQPSLARAAGLPPPPAGWRAVSILTMADGAAAQEPFELPLGEAGSSDYGAARLAAVEAYARRGPSVYRRAALRFLYSGEAFELDGEALRRALDLGVSLGDPLARVLALSQLGCAPATPENLRRLDALADESRFAIGPAAAAKLAAAYARFGHPAAARVWKERAESGPDGLPQGLLDVVDGRGPLGRVGGRLRGLAGARLGLYCRTDVYSPYALGPSQLVAGTAPGRDGRFTFGELPAGSYFLAVAADAPRPWAKPWRLRGHRGDLVVTIERPKASVDLEVAR